MADESLGVPATPSRDPLQPAVSASPANAAQPMVIAAARELNKRFASSCNVNAEDQWNLESEVFISDAEAALKAAGVPWMLETLRGCLHFDDAFIAEGPLGRALIQWRTEAEKVIGKATGRQS